MDSGENTMTGESTTMDSPAVSEEKYSRCYQCGKCSTGCPVADAMDMLPHQVIHLLSLGLEERVLPLNTLWMCAGCYTCAVRCPNDIDVTAVMGRLREKALAAGLPCSFPDVLTFHRNFLRDVSRRGRVHEMRMMGEYNLKTGRPFHDLRVALKMLLKRRLPLRAPRRVPGFKRWIRKAGRE